MIEKLGQGTGFGAGELEAASDRAIRALKHQHELVAEIQKGHEDTEHGTVALGLLKMYRGPKGTIQNQELKHGEFFPLTDSAKTVNLKPEVLLFFLRLTRGRNVNRLLRSPQRSFRRCGFSMQNLNSVQYSSMS